MIVSLLLVLLLLLSLPLAESSEVLQCDRTVAEDLRQRLEVKDGVTPRVDCQAQAHNGDDVHD